MPLLKQNSTCFGCWFKACSAHLTSCIHYRKKWKYPNSTVVSCFKWSRVACETNKTEKEGICDVKNVCSMCRCHLEDAIFLRIANLQYFTKKLHVRMTCQVEQQPCGRRANIRCDNALGNPSLSPVSVCSPFSFPVTPQTALTKNITFI